MANTTAQVRAAYQAIRDAILADMQSNPTAVNSVQSYQVMGRTVQYRSVKERADLLKWVEARILELGTGMLQLVRFTDL